MGDIVRLTHRSDPGIYRLFTLSGTGYLLTLRHGDELILLAHEAQASAVIRLREFSVFVGQQGLFIIEIDENQAQAQSAMPLAGIIRLQ